MHRTIDDLHHSAPLNGRADTNVQTRKPPKARTPSPKRQIGGGPRRAPARNRKSKEEFLSEELRAVADFATRHFQWGVTLLISVQTALFFVRRDVLNGLIDGGIIPKGSELPIPRYVIGTLFLFVVATILSMVGARHAKQYRHYKMQLAESRQSGIVDLPIKHTARWMYALYYIFPIIDVLYRLYVDIRLQ